jgi:hypothetical protein
MISGQSRLLRNALKQPVAAVGSWSGPDVRERHLFGASMRTTGFGQGNPKP